MPKEYPKARATGTATAFPTCMYLLHDQFLYCSCFGIGTLITNLQKNIVYYSGDSLTRTRKMTMFNGGQSKNCFLRDTKQVFLKQETDY